MNAFTQHGRHDDRTRKLQNDDHFLFAEQWYTHFLFTHIIQKEKWNSLRTVVLLR